MGSSGAMGEIVSNGVIRTGRLSGRRVLSLDILSTKRRPVSSGRAAGDAPV